MALDRHPIALYLLVNDFLTSGTVLNGRKGGTRHRGAVSHAIMSADRIIAHAGVNVMSDMFITILLDVRIGCRFSTAQHFRAALPWSTQSSALLWPPIPLTGEMNS